MFKTHINNLAGIKGAVTHFGNIWFHGDGNIYDKKADSDFRKDFSNNSNGPETYRVNYRYGDKLPTTLEELHVALLSSKTREMQEAQLPKSATAVSTFKVELPEPVVAPVVEPVPFVAPITLPITDAASMASTVDANTSTVADVQPEIKTKSGK